MMRSKDFNKEVNIVKEKAKKGEATISDLTKIVCLIGQVIRDIKSNQATMMIAQGFLKKPNVKKTERPK